MEHAVSIGLGLRRCWGPRRWRGCDAALRSSTDRASFLLRLQLFLPKLAELHEPRLQRAEAKPVGGVLPRHAIVALDQRFDVLARLPWQPREAPGEEHVV